MEQVEIQQEDRDFTPLAFNQQSMVVKSNKLIEARYRLSLQEQRLILLLTSKIRKEDVDFLWYKLNIRDLAKFLGLEKNRNIYESVRKAVRRLMRRIITIEDINTDLHWIDAASYGEKGVVKIAVHQILKPYLLSLRSHFTKYYLKYIVYLKSVYSIRLYEILKRYENVGEAVLMLENLREMMGIKETEYQAYNNFKRKTLLVAQEEIPQKTDINFSFEELKEGKRVTKIRFLIRSQKPLEHHSTPDIDRIIEGTEIRKSRWIPFNIPLPAKEDDPNAAAENTAENLDQLLDLVPPKYREMKSVQNVIQRYLVECGFNFTARNINYTNAKSNAVKPGANPLKEANYCVYLSKALAGDFGLPFQENLEVVTAEKAAEEQTRRAMEELDRQKATRQKQENENRAKAEAILQNLTSLELEELRKQAIDRLPDKIKNNRFSSMMIKVEMQKIALEREAGKPQQPTLQGLSM